MKLKEEWEFVGTRFIRIPIIQNDIEVYERCCTYWDLEQNIPTLNKFSHGLIPTHILIPYNVGFFNSKPLVIHYAYHCLLLCRYHFGEGKYMNHIMKRSSTILINKRKKFTQLPHHHMLEINIGCWEHKNISFIVFLGCDESNNLFLHHHMPRVRIASWEEKIGIAFIVT